MSNPLCWMFTYLTLRRERKALFCFCERFTNFPIAPKTIHEMKLLSSNVTVITILLAAPRAFGSKLHFENMEVSTGELTDISNDGPPEEGTCCCRLSWRAVSYQPSGVAADCVFYSSNQLIKKPRTHTRFCVCLTPP